MDIFTLEAVTAELQQHIGSARIDKIFQPEPELLVMRLWNGHENLRLLISVAPRSPRLHLTQQSFPNPPAPPRFCQLLRSRISRILEVRQCENERIVQVCCKGEQGRDYLLVVELLGRRSNLVLVDDHGVIVDVWKREPEGFSGRALLAGEAYLPPSPRHLIPLAELKTLPPDLAEPEAMAQWLLRQVTPMSSFVAAEMVAGLQKGCVLKDLVEELLLRRSRHQYSPSVGRFRGKPFISPFPILYIDLEEKKDFLSASQATEYFYHLLLGDAGEVGEQRSLLQLVLRRESRALRRLEQIREDQEAQKDVERLRETGELLLAHLFRLKKGMQSLDLEDYYRDPPQPRTISLDARLTPSENAEQYFRLYKKSKRAAEHIARRLQETQHELAWLASVRHALEQAVEPVDVAVIRGELEEVGLLVASRRVEKRMVADIGSRVRSALSPGGYRILWGRNNRTNDLVTRELADAHDWWFHAHRVPGCHLVLKLRHKDEVVPQDDLLFAASLAAGYSKAADSSKVEVMLTRVAEVRKPPGARPGMVTVRTYKTLMVVPQKKENSN